MMRRSLVSHGVLLVSLFVAGRASAVETQACLEASQKGQDARDSGKLIESRLYFTTCADAACPRPVPSYCLDWIKDVSRRIPSLVIRVTDAQGRDLVDVTTKIDGVTIGTKLDGRPVEVKPGNHRIELESGGARTEQTLLVVESEKGRVITAKLDTGGRALPVATTAVTTPELPAAASDRPVPVTSWVAWGVGAVALVAFGVFGLKAKSDFDGYQSTGCSSHRDAAARCLRGGLCGLRAMTFARTVTSA